MIAVTDVDDALRRPQHLVREYVDALLDVERSPGEADRVVLRALQGGADPRWILLHAIPAVLHEVGDRWHAGEISTGDERVATTVIQSTMRDLGTRLERSPRLGLVAVVAAVGREQHDNGPRLLADVLDADGWDVLFAGAATPASALVRLVNEREPQAVALGITLPRYLPALERTVRALKTQIMNSPFVLVGGQGCAGQSDFAHRIGADAHASTIEDAVALLRQPQRQR